MCPENEDINQEKVDAVATYVSEAGAINFRYMLHGLARGRQRDLIEEDLKDHDGLTAYLKIYFDDALSDKERRYCSDWGVKAADHVKNDPIPERDRKIAERLKDHKEPDGRNPDGLGPVGA